MGGRTDAAWGAAAAPRGRCPPVPKQPLQGDAARPAGPAASGGPQPCGAPRLWMRGRAAGPGRGRGFGGARRDPAPAALPTSPPGGEPGRWGRLPPHPRSLRSARPERSRGPGRSLPGGSSAGKRRRGVSAVTAAKQKPSSSETGLQEALMS